MLGWVMEGGNLPGTLFELCCEPGRTGNVFTARLLETLIVVGRLATGRALLVESEAPDVRGLPVVALFTCGLGPNFFFFGFTAAKAATSSFHWVIEGRSVPEG